MFQRIEIGPRVHDPDLGISIEYSRRDMPPGQYHVMLSIDASPTSGFDVVRTYVEDKKTFIYVAPKTDVGKIFRRDKWLRDTFETEAEFIDKLKEGVALLFSESSTISRGVRVICEVK